MNSYYLLFIMCIIISLIGIIYHKVEQNQDIELAKNLIQFFMGLFIFYIFALVFFISKGMTLCYLGKTIFC